MARTTKKIYSLFLVMLFLFTSLPVYGTAEQEFVKGKRGTFFAIPRQAQPYANMSSSFQVAWQTGASKEDYGNVMTSSCAEVAMLMKKYLSRQPEGRRAIRSTSLTNMIVEALHEEHFWYENGMKRFNQVWDELFYYYKRLGGPDVDYFFMDLEDGCDVWNMELHAKKLGKTIDEVYTQVTEDPRYETDVRPSLIEYGIELYEGDDHNELYNLYANANAYPHNAPEMKNVYLGILWAYERRDKALESHYELVKSYFPNVKYMNYDSREINIPKMDSSQYGHCYGWFSEPVQEEGRQHRFPWKLSAWPCYATLREEALSKSPPHGYPYAFKSTGYNAVLLHIMQMRNALSYMADSAVLPFVCSYSYAYLGLNPTAMSDYYDELIFQLAMGLDGDGTLAFYNTEHWQRGIDDDLVLSELLYELDEVAGFPERTPLLRDMIPWTTHILVNGVSAGGRNVFRVTPDLFVEDMTKEKVLVSDNPPVFRIANETVTFPEGSFIYEPENAHSKVGFWVISPEGTLPEVVFDETKPIAAQTTYQFRGEEELKEREEAYRANLEATQNVVMPVDLFRTKKRYSDFAVFKSKF